MLWSFPRGDRLPGAGARRRNSSHLREPGRGGDPLRALERFFARLATQYEGAFRNRRRSMRSTSDPQTSNLLGGSCCEAALTARVSASRQAEFGFSLTDQIDRGDALFPRGGSCGSSRPSVWKDEAKGRRDLQSVVVLPPSEHRRRRLHGRRPANARCCDGWWFVEALRNHGVGIVLLNRYRPDRLAFSQQK